MADGTARRRIIRQGLAATIVLLLLAATPGAVAFETPESGQSLSVVTVLTAPASPRGPAMITTGLQDRLAALSQGERNHMVGVILELRSSALSEAASRVWRRTWIETSLPGPATDTEAATGQPDVPHAILDARLDASRGEIYARAERALEPLVADLERQIRNVGGDVLGFTPTLPAVFARMPLSTVPVLAAHPAVARISEDGWMLAAMDVSPYAIFADDWWGAGFTGGTWDLAVIDTGMDGSHPALAVDLSRVFHAAGQFDACYVDNSASTDDLHGHGTHIAGTVTSTDATYRGVAYGMDVLINGKAGWLCSNGSARMYWSDAMDAVDWAIQTGGADVISFSFGGSPGAGDTPIARFFDAVADDLGVVVAISAGNDGPGGGTVHEPASAYNVLSVANVNDANTVSRADDSIWTTSSRGPTGDGRLKPDIAAPGTQIMSANTNWEAQADFVAWTGTSMAAPHVAAAALLLMDEGGPAPPLVYKALLLNAADDRGPAGPDNGYGWGYMNLRQAFQNRGGVHVGLADPGATGYRLFAGPVPSGGKATLVWNRHATYAGSNYPTTFYGLNNLNLLAFDGSDGLRVADSTSTLDNVEQVVASVPYPSLVYKVVALGPLAGVSQETFALAAGSGVVPVSPPSLSATVSVAGTAEFGTVFTVTATVANGGEVAAHGVQATLSVPPGLGLVSGANPQPLGSIGARSNATASWQLSADSLGPHSLSLSAESTCYGETFTATSGAFVVTVGDTTPPTSSAGTLPPFRRAPAFTVTATASDLSPITSVELSYRRNGGPWTPFGTDTAAPWSWTFDADAAGGDGLFEFYTVATDASGNLEPAPAAADVSTIVDRIPPVSSHTLNGSEGDGGWYTGPVNASLAATDAGSGIDAIEFDLDGEGWGLYTNPFEIAEDGAHTISFRALDRAGNAESSRSVTVRIDGTAPEVSIAEPVQGAVVTSSSVTVRWSRAESGSGLRDCSVSVDGGPPAAAGARTTHELTGLGNGAHDLRVTCDDLAGNRGEASLRFQVQANPFSLSGPFGPWLLVGVILIVVAVGVAIFFFRQRQRPRPPM